MSVQNPTPGEVGTCKVEIEPVTVQSGGEFSLSARVVCTPPCDREGERLFVLDHAGETVGVLTLGPYDGNGGNDSDAITLVAPIAVGTLDWRVVVPECEAGDVQFPEAATECLVTVEAHRVDVVVWDAPPAVVAGEPFRVKVGTKCSGACVPDGWTVQLADGGDEPSAEVRLGDSLWPGSKGLYYTEVELAAPPEPGRYRWTARLLNVAEDAPHEVEETGFGVHCTAAPECVVEVEVLDLETHAPLANATVQLHPFRARTDADGVARIAVPRGNYRLLVSGTKHIPHSAELDVARDCAERVELVADRELTEADIW